MTQLDMSPIEVALADMRKQCEEMAQVIFSKPTNAVLLEVRTQRGKRGATGDTDLRTVVLGTRVATRQMRLQGSVALQVNAGPLHVAQVFLSKENESKVLGTVCGVPGGPSSDANARALTGPRAAASIPPSLSSSCVASLPSSCACATKA